MLKEVELKPNVWSGGSGDGVNISLDMTVGNSIDKFRDLMISVGDFLPKNGFDWNHPNYDTIEQLVSLEYITGGPCAYINIYDTKIVGVQFVFTYNDYKDTKFVGIFKNGKFVFELRDNENILKNINKLNKAIKKFL